MTPSKAPLWLAAALGLSACGGLDQAAFVTSTNVGIDFDATARKVLIGYDRSEGFIGPTFVDDGVAPPIVGFISSDLAVFDPKIRQLYATGEAAEIVTRSDKGNKPEPEAMSGNRRPMIFGTTTSIALKVGFGAAQAFPDSVSFGYKRREASVIPFTPAGATGPAKYASVLASIDMGVSPITTPQSTRLRATQFFATGNAARNLAWREDIRQLFEQEAVAALSAGAQDAVREKVSRSVVVSCIQKKQAGFNDAAKLRLKTLLSQAVAKKILTAAQMKAVIEDGTEPVSLDDTIKKLLSGNAAQLEALVKAQSVQLCEA